jgi:hypothetical protein
MDFKIPFELIRHFKVAHHVKGRIRFRIAPAALDYVSQVNSHEFTSLIRSLPGIHDVRINTIAGSVIVYYNPLRVAPSWWDQLLHSNQSEMPQLLAQVQT